MNYLVFLILGFGTLWAGLKLFDDEVLLYRVTLPRVRIGTSGFTLFSRVATSWN